MKRSAIGALHGNGAVVFAAGAVTAVLQTLLIREVYAVVSGNELVIGLMLAVWLAATAAGSAVAERRMFRSINILLIGMVVAFIAGMTGIRAARLLLLPGASFSPHLLLLLLMAVEAPGAMLGGYLFGTMAHRSGGRRMYRSEQAGTLFGAGIVTLAVWRCLPNYAVASGIFLLLIPLIRGGVWRLGAVAAVAVFFVTDHPTAAWKYPLPVSRVVYAHEGEVGAVTVDGQQLTYVNGLLFSVSYATPAVEQAVLAPLSMHPRPDAVLVVNSAGHREAAMRYQGADVRCVRLDRLIADTCCPYGNLGRVERREPFDAVILGCSMPDNAATSRFFTRGFIRKIHTLTGDSGIFSFTLPFQTEYTDSREETIRSIIAATLRSVYRYVKILPGEGFTFLASDAEYPLPDTCSVANDYFQSMVLSALTPERIRNANRPPGQTRLHTAAHPRLLLPVLDGYLQKFSYSRWMFIAVPVLLVLLLVPAVRTSRDMVSVGSSGMCTGIYSVAMILMYQSVYGTVYSQLSLLLLSLSIGFTAGCFVRRFPFSDLVIGAVLAGSLSVFVALRAPPAPLFFLGNAVAGFLASAQFVTRKTEKTGLLYAADCAGGVLGMSLASTVLVPLWGMGAVAAGIAVVKAGAGWKDGG
jgi:hypothetical protein